MRRRGALLLGRAYAQPDVSLAVCADVGGESVRQPCAPDSSARLTNPDRLAYKVTASLLGPVHHAQLASRCCTGTPPRRRAALQQCPCCRQLASGQAKPAGRTRARESRIPRACSGQTCCIRFACADVDLRMTVPDQDGRKLSLVADRPMTAEHATVEFVPRCYRKLVRAQ